MMANKLTPLQIARLIVHLRAAEHGFGPMKLPLHWHDAALMDKGFVEKHWQGCAITKKGRDYLAKMKEAT